MSRPLTEIDKTVIEGMKNGDMASFDIIYRTYSKRLFGFVLQIIKNDSDAEEIVQEVFIRIWESRRQIDSFSLFDSYLFTIAYNKTISLIRKRLSEKKYIDYVKSLQNISETPEPYDESEFNKLSEHVNSLVDQLPPRQKQVFKLHRQEGLAYQEIAEKMNISKNTVENHMAKALKFLRQRINMEHLAGLFFVWMFL
jgi:RNA polymerase sigma-70 factor, ECF subfamily